MKTTARYFLFLMIVSAFFTACNREEPLIITPTPPAPAAVKMNEVYSRGDSLAPDWIEIYNPNSSAIVIGGYKIYDNGGQTGAKAKKTIPAGTSIAANGFYVITVDTTDASGFGISSSGETVWFENAGGSLIDSVVIPALGVDTSYARSADGTGTWAKKTLPTKGATNVAGGAALPIVMNEIFSRGIASDPDWIELYNPNSAPVTIGGYKLYDGGGNTGTKPKLEIVAGTTIPANGYAVIVVDITTEAWGFGLGSGGDEAWLENSGGVVIDHQVVPAMPVATTSYSRVPNGSATWVISNTITKGAVNQP
jgi:LEA14-like dessication related protein